ncbi:helix-turn-helix domain-containing protein [Candidatus Woesearchaeota archaeon]|nr:helix-turn-helix domain-containing protein [Candidatus Woesearchaeota archaeon]
MVQRVTIIKLRHGSAGDVNQELQWLGNSLGLFNLRDRDSSCFRVFITMVKRTRKNEPISSDEIAEQLKLSRGTVVHHLTKLIDAGLIIRERERYLLREQHLQKLIQDIRRDAETILQDMENLAREIDLQLG